MKAEEFSDFAKEMVEYVADYLENIRERRVMPEVSPGYLAPLLPEEAPVQPDSWQEVMADVERLIMPGITHWHSPRFHAYFPSANSYPAIVADMLSGAIACVGFNWIASPACTELEQITMDWLAQIMGMPEEFLCSSPGEGGGVIQSTTSESTLLALLTARAGACAKAKQLYPHLSDSEVTAKLVAYGSEQSHSSVERAGLLGGVTMRLLPTDERLSLRGETLREAVLQDRAAGLIPFYAVATLGTTCTCAFDNLDEMGRVTEAEDMWLHVDAAYAGSSFICPEFRHLLAGVQRVDSFCFNPHKWMLVNFDCAAMWLKNPKTVIDTFRVDPLHLRQETMSSAPDFRHWQIPLGRRFRALKLWFVLRLYGVKNIQAYIRKHVALAKEFESYVRKDDRFEIVGEVVCGLVCVRLRGPNKLTEELLRRINSNGVIHLVPAEVKGIFFMRFAVCSRYTNSDDIRFSWAEIQKQVTTVATIEPLLLAATTTAITTAAPDITETRVGDRQIGA